MKLENESNYPRTKAAIANIIDCEMERIENSPDLQHLVLE